MQRTGVGDDRCQALNRHPVLPGPVAYWMSRDQRSEDNWALLRAQQLALEAREPLHVVFCLATQFLGATWRQYEFMLQGLEAVSASLADKHIHFHLLIGDPVESIIRFCQTQRIGVLVTDFDPLRIKRQWQSAVSGRVPCAVQVVDAHNIVPCWRASEKQEFSARTLRLKLNRLLPEYLVSIPPIRRHPFFPKEIKSPIDWPRIGKILSVDRTVASVRDLQPGTRPGMRAARTFFSGHMGQYAAQGNDPVLAVTSRLSAYLHFGQISAQRVALEAAASLQGGAGKDAFLEQLVVRRELSDNFVYYNPTYDQVKGFPAWGRATLAAHRSDLREYRYAVDRFENASTHDPLWNAAQRQMSRTGFMHGYMRMYWAKKILEWSPSPERALQTAIALNDKYQLDGRDPNGYTGLAWSMGGVHDRPWAERPIYGKIRYMNDKGCARKFTVAAYLSANAD